MAKIEEYELLQCDDGIYFGKALKNGTISKDSVKITDEQILTMFENYLERFCARNVTNVLEVQRDGKTVIEAKLFIR